MLKSFLLKQLIKAKMKNVPADVQERILSAIDKNPKIFEELAAAAQEKMKQGKDQMTAMTEAAKEREAELRGLLGQ